MKMKLIFLFLTLLLYLGSIECLTQAEKEECLKAHNELRELMVDTKPLKWDDNLAHKAQMWAENNLKRDKMVHKKPNKDGENIAYGKSYKGPRSCASAVLAWFNEIQYYNFTTGNTKDGHHIGHFTQLVWHDTQKVGVGIASKTVGGRTTTYIVAEYQPKGNRILMHWGESYPSARSRTYFKDKEVEDLGINIGDLKKYEPSEESLQTDEKTNQKRTSMSAAVDLSDLDIYDDDVEVIREAPPATKEDSYIESVESIDTKQSESLRQRNMNTKREFKAELKSDMYHPRQLTIQEDPSMILDNINRKREAYRKREKKREVGKPSTMETKIEEDEEGSL